MAGLSKFNQRNRIVFLWIAAPVLLGLMVVTAPGFDDTTIMPDLLEVLGVCCVVACIAGRCWAVLYVGGRKNQTLVRNGPYAVVRNPLYFFSAIGMLGVGLMAESITLALLLAGFTYLVFRYVARREEDDLLRLFGREYERYRAEVPRFVPKLSALTTWRVTNEPVLVSPKAIFRTFVDALVFLLAFPFAELLEYLHSNGMVAVLLHLY